MACNITKITATGELYGGNRDKKRVFYQFTFNQKCGCPQPKKQVKISSDNNVMSADDSSDSMWEKCRIDFESKHQVCGVTIDDYNICKDMLWKSGMADILQIELDNKKNSDNAARAHDSKKRKQADWHVGEDFQSSERNQKYKIKKILLETLMQRTSSNVTKVKSLISSVADELKSKSGIHFDMLELLDNETQTKMKTFDSIIHNVRSYRNQIKYKMTQQDRETLAAFCAANVSRES